MKTNPSGFAALIACGALSLVLAVPSVAGARFNGNGQVTVILNSNGSGVASGYLGMIYNGPGLVEYIGCQKSAANSVFCHARNEGELRASCSVNSAYLARAVASLSPDARLTFRFNATGRCTAISVIHSSEYQDKLD